MRCRWMFVILVLLVLAAPAQSQTFSSGSTGADGPGVCNGNTVSWQIPESGIFNFTTVNISNCTVTFTPNQRNTPAIILAQGDVSIVNSSVRVDASGRTAGPGGFYGGGVNQAGFGPGGGVPPGGAATWVGPLSLVPPIGGSGGAGDGYYEGAGGGGAIVIASSTSIQCSGGIFAGGMGGGSGGAIRLVANSIAGSCQLRATGGSGNHGLVRVEAQPGQLLFTGATTPAAVLTVVNPQVIPTSSTASLTIASIGGFPVLSDAGGRPGNVDVVLPRALTDPISIAVQGRNIPVGTQVNLTASGSAVTYTPGSLAGSLDVSTATLQVSGLDRSAETHLFVFATFDVPQSAATLNPAGPNQIAKVRVESEIGKPSRMSFLRKDGSEVDPGKVPVDLLTYFSYLPR